MIPADLRIIQARDSFVAQALLTGESSPVEKSPRRVSPGKITRLSATRCALWGRTS